MTEQAVAAKPPATSAEAAARLDTLTADKNFTVKLLSGSGPEVKEFQDLIAQKISGDRTDQILNGTIELPMIDSHLGSELTTRSVMDGVDALRAVGIRDEVIRDVLQGVPASKADKEAAQRLYADRVSDESWRTRLLKGGAVERRELALMHIIKNAPLREEKAS